MTNNDVAHYHRLLHRFGVDSKKIQEFEESHRNDTPLVKRMAFIKKHLPKRR